MARPSLWSLGFGGGAAASYCAVSLPRAMPQGLAILFACGLAGAVVGAAAWWRWVRPIEQRERRAHVRFIGVCADGGYSLRGNASGVCPECGTKK